MGLLYSCEQSKIVSAPSSAGSTVHIGAADVILNMKWENYH